MKPSGRKSTNITVSSQQVFINFANLYWRFIQDFSRLATSLIAMLKIIGSSVTSAFRVDDDEVVNSNGGAGAENGESIVKRKVDSITSNNWLNSQRGSYKSPQQVFDLVDVFFLDLASELPEHTGINDRAIKLVNANGFTRPSKLPLQ